MPPFIPDVPYKIQFIFVLTFSYVWSTAFIDNYEEPTPAETSPFRYDILRWNALRGLASIVVFMLSFSYLNPYIDQIFKPYQRFWRMIAELTKFYLCFIIFFLHQRPDHGRAIWGFLDPSLNQKVEKEMHTYDDHCEFTLENIWDNVDHYFAIHLIDWFLASLVIRDPYILHLWSIMDEFVELSFQHILPHFRECWWDHILMDITLTNTPAIILGMMTVRYFGIKEYDWLGRKGKNSIVDWEIWRCHRRFGIVSYQFILLLIHFVAGFFLINAFLIPPKHVFTISRLFLWFLFGNIGMREAYEDVSTWNTHYRKDHPVEGRHRWLSVGILLTESILVYKYREGTGNLLNEPTPLIVSIPWAIFYGLIGFYWVYLRFRPDRTRKFLEHPPAHQQVESKKVK